MPGKRANVPAEDAEDQVSLGLTETDLPAFVHAQVLSAERQPGEFTIAEMMQNEGATREAIEGVLRRAMKDGKVARREAIVNGTRGHLYRMVG